MTNVHIQQLHSHRHGLSLLQNNFTSYSDVDNLTTQPTTMENSLNYLLLPVEDCAICGDAFGTTHHPAALPCKHIFGHACIEKWFNNGKGNNRACPTCRFVVVVKKESPEPPFTVSSIWAALTEQPLDRLHAFMRHIWNRLQMLWQQTPDGNFTVTQILEGAIIPALLQTGREVSISQNRMQNAMIDSYNLVVGTRDSRRQPNTAIGLAIPLVRLARLMSSASTTLPKWLTTNPQANHLIWRANACIGLTETEIRWEPIIEASRLKNEQHFPLLYLYTVLLSQSIAHSSPPSPWPIKRHEVMNLVVDRCCTRIGRLGWQGRPTNHFKEILVTVYEDLRRYHLEKKGMTLKGDEGEDVVVKGIWALAQWTKRQNAER